MWWNYRIYNEDADAEAKSNDEAKSYNKTRTILTNFNENKANWKTKNFYILFSFLSTTTALLIDASIYSFLIKYQAKQKTVITIWIHK